jgi:hypothetical protein
MPTKGEQIVASLGGDLQSCAQGPAGFDAMIRLTPRFAIKNSIQLAKRAASTLGFVGPRNERSTAVGCPAGAMRR